MKTLKWLLGPALLKTLLGISAVPVGLLTARCLSEVVTFAVAGKTGEVLYTGLRLLLLLVGYKLAEIVCAERLEMYQAHMRHRAKIELYHIYLSGCLNVLYQSSGGEAKERLQDDFKRVTERILTLIPDLIVGALSSVIYLLYLLKRSPVSALVLTLIGLTQLVPPLIVRRFLQKNYQDTRQIEAEITDFTLQAHTGLAEIKVFGLEDWFVEKLEKLHRAYLRIGNCGILANTTEISLRQFVAVAQKFGTYALVGVLMLWEVVRLEQGIEAITLSASLFAGMKLAFSSVTGFSVAKTARNRLEAWCKPQPVSKTMVNSSVKLTRVSVEFAEKTILEKFTAAFPDNGLYLICGQNGTGKSTLLRLIAGLCLPDKGAVCVGDVAPKELSEGGFLRDMLYLPQEDAAFDIAAAELYRMAEGLDVNRALNCAGEFGLSTQQLENTHIANLSGGERKKVYLALALASDARLLRLDEPTNDLDAVSRTLLAEKLTQRTGLTLVVTHDAVFTSGKVCHMEKGGLRFEA